MRNTTAQPKTEPQLRPSHPYFSTVQDHRFKVTGRIFGTAPYGIAVAKTSGLAVPIRDALRALIATGAYHSITSKWGISTGDITSPVINGATS
jgi:polar amino acid transport system substrate-binding protein